IIFESKTAFALRDKPASSFFEILAAIRQSDLVLNFLVLESGFIFFARADSLDDDIERQLALTLAHDLRSPLATMYYLACLVEDQAEKRHVDRMKRQLLLCESM